MTIIFDQAKFHFLTNFTWAATNAERVLLVNKNAWTPAAGDVFVNDAFLAGAVEVTAAGYVRQILPNPRNTLDNVGDRALAYSDVIRFDTIAPADTFDTMIVYHFVTSDVDSWLIAAYDLGAHVTDGSAPFISPDSNGLFAIDRPNEAPTFISESPFDGFQFTSYFYQFTAAGFPDATFSLFSGTLPDGLTLDPSGVLSGTPTTIAAFVFNVIADNGIAPPATTGDLTVNIFSSDVPPTMIDFAPPDGTDGVPFSYFFTADGSPVPTFSISAGTQPTGLTLNGTTGELSGTPTVSGPFSFDVTATNGVAPDDTHTIAMTINVSGGGPTPPGIPHPGGGVWTEVFGDEFQTPTIDGTKWDRTWLAGPTGTSPPINGNEDAYYDSSQVTVDGTDICTLTAVAVGSTVVGGRTFTRKSGIIQTQPHFTFSGGYVEARVWLPPGSGTPQNWPAFWTDTNGTWPAGGEIDIMEILSGQWAYHLHDSINPGGDGATVGGTSAGWHIFGVNWISGTSLDFYYDNVLVGHIGRAPVGPHFVICNLAVSASIDNPIITPSSLMIDYIRVWQ